MLFPNFEFCVICEGVRQEIGGKLTILGFYGMAPNVDVSIRNPNLAVVLHLVTGFPSVPESDATYENIVTVTRPVGVVALQAPPQKLIVSSTKRSLLGIPLVIEPPHVWGRHSIRIHVNRELKLDTSFNLSLATLAELAASERPN
jgi:hypothetical protein